jgi:hypothetical protein
MSSTGKQHSDLVEREKYFLLDLYKDYLMLNFWWVFFVVKKGSKNNT